MKSSSIKIYQLIHHLEKAEKRYFTLYAKRHQIGDANNYLELFQLIKDEGIQSDRQLTDFLKKTNKSYSFANYLSVAKKQLMESILKGLCQYNQSSSIEENIKILCHKANILFEKGLIKEAEKKIKKAKKIALSVEKFHLILEAIEIQKKIISSVYYNESSFDDLIALSGETNKYLKILKNKDAYWLLFSQVYKLHFQKSGDRKERNQNEILYLMKHPLLEKEEMALSISAKLDFLQLNALKHFIKGEAPKAFIYNKQFLNVFTEHPNILKTQAARYQSSLNNFLIDCAQLNYGEELKKGLLILRSLPKNKAYKKQNNTEMQVFRLSYQIELNWNISKGNFKDNYLLLPLIQKRLEQYKTVMVDQSLVVFYYILAYSCFAIGKFDESLIWTNKIINETNEQSMVALQGTTRNLNLLAHFELGNYELLNYSIENTKRYLKKRGDYLETEKVLLKGLNKLINKPIINHTAIYKQLNKSFNEQNRDVAFNFNYWVQSKLEGKTYEEVYQEQLVLN